MFYVAENRKAVKEANPGMAFGALSKLIGQNWKNCDEALKANSMKKPLLTKSVMQPKKRNGRKKSK